MFPAIWKWKNWFLAISSLTNTVAAIWREKKVESLLFGDQKMQFTTVRSKEKIQQQLDTRKQCYPAIWKCKKLVPSYFESDKHCCSYLAREKSGSLLFGDKKFSSKLLVARKKIMTSI